MSENEKLVTARKSASWFPSDIFKCSGQITWTEFSKAIQDGDLEIVSKFVLIHHARAYTSYIRAKPGQKSLHKQFALKLAAYHGHFNVFEYLYTHPAWETAAKIFEHELGINDDWHLYRVLETACRKGHRDIVLLMTAPNLQWLPRMPSVYEALVVAACESGDVDIAKVIIEQVQLLGFSRIIDVAYRKGASYSFLQQVGYSSQWINKGLRELMCTPAHRTVYLLDKEGLDSLPVEKYWADYTDMIGRTAFDQACVMGNVDFVQEMVSRKKMLDSNVPFREESLKCACEFGRRELVKFLLDYEWTGGVEWCEVLDSCVVLALENARLPVAKILLHRLLELMHHKKHRSTVGKFLDKFRKQHSLSRTLLISISENGDHEMLHSIFSRTKIGFKNVMDMYDHCKAFGSVYSLAYLFKEFNELLPNMNQELLVLGCADTSLVAFEFLISKIGDSEGLLRLLVQELLFSGQSELIACNFRKRVFYLQKLNILQHFCDKYPNLRLLKLSLPTQLLRNVDILFDVSDFSDTVLVREGTPVEFDRQFIHSSSHHLDDPRRRHQVVCLLQSMCGWKERLLVWDTFFAAHQDISAAEKQFMIELFEQTGFWVLDNSVNDDDPHFGPYKQQCVAAQNNASKNQGYPNLGLKSLCRILIRTRMRKCHPYTSMASMVASLHIDRIVPRSLVQFLLFRDVELPVMDRHGMELMGGRRRSFVHIQVGGETRSLTSED